MEDKKDKIKIAHCLSGLDGGVASVILNYFDHMPLEDYEVDIIAQGEPKQLYIDRYESRGFHVYMVPSKKESLWGNFKALYALMHKRKYHIVHAHMTLTNFFPLCVALLCGIKVRISHSHMASYHTVKSRVLALLSRMVATDSLACSCAAGRFLFGNASFVELKNAIDLEEYRFNKDTRAEEREKLGVGEEEKLVGHIGRFSQQKNHEFLIDIFENLHKKLPDSRLILIGDGELEDRVREKVYRQGLQDSVIFCGAVNDVSRKLQAMDLCLLPSRYEGLPVVAIEAQAAGLGCVLSENITREVQLCPNVRFVSLTGSVERWSDVCVELISMNRQDSASLLKEAGYDIGTEAERLDAFYRARVRM